ncbi:hypothetical protein J6590_008611 [Homalodisca vitripennis]|nr:hypothetical protein J6590_008611 [Homalodisca vitripennis]
MGLILQSNLFNLGIDGDRRDTGREQEAVKAVRFQPLLGVEICRKSGDSQGVTRGGHGENKSDDITDTPTAAANRLLQNRFDPVGGQSSLMSHASVAWYCKSASKCLTQCRAWVAVARGEVKTFAG